MVFSGRREGTDLQVREGCMRNAFSFSPKFNTITYGMYCLLQVSAIPKMNIVLFAIKVVSTHGL